MKRLALAIVAGVAGLVGGLMMSNAIIRPMISFIAPPELGVSIVSTSVSGALWIALPWAFFVAVLAAVTCWVSPRCWRPLTVGLLITATVVLSVLTIQRLQVARGVGISHQLTQSEHMFLPIEALHLGRTGVLGIVAFVLSTIGVAQFRKHRNLANTASHGTLASSRP